CVNQEEPMQQETFTSYETLIAEDRIHTSLYTDPRIFTAEMEKIFSRGWVFVGHDSEIPQPGDFVTRFIGQQPVIMVRGEFIAGSNFLLVELSIQAQHETHLWAGRTTHKLRWANDQLKMVEKKVVLVNAAEAIPNLSFLI